ncbi:hypothetical protein JTB14_007057 [Gonioctena quinquepunctata]|nr:hypothetical protein JTB14_007057 [Gonioctena quinquepunctata]
MPLRGVKKPKDGPELNPSLHKTLKITTIDTKIESFHGSQLRVSTDVEQRDAFRVSVSSIGSDDQQRGFISNSILTVLMAVAVFIHENYYTGLAAFRQYLFVAEMISIRTNRVKTVYESLSPILFFSRAAAVCTITKDENKGEFVRSKCMMAIQIVVLITSILHFIFIPYAVINIEKMPQISLGINQTVTDTSLSSQKFITKMANIVLISMSAISVRLWNLMKMHKVLPDLLKDLKTFDDIFRTKNDDFVWILSLSGEHFPHSQHVKYV